MIIPFPIPRRYFEDKSLWIGWLESKRVKRNSEGYGEAIDEKRKAELRGAWKLRKLELAEEID